MVSLRPQLLSCSLLVEVPMLVHFQSAIQVWAEHRNVSCPLIHIIGKAPFQVSLFQDAL